MWVCRDSRVSGARGAAPCCGKAAISERGESSLCGDKPSAERTRPQGCISAPFVPKGLFAFPALGAFFQISPRFLARQGKPEERRRLPRRSWSWLPAQCSQRPHPGRSADGCASCVPLGITFVRNTFSRFSKLPDFLLPVLNLGLQFLAVFSSRFRSWVVAPFCLSA